MENNKEEKPNPTKSEPAIGNRQSRNLVRVAFYKGQLMNQRLKVKKKRVRHRRNAKKKKIQEQAITVHHDADSTTTPRSFEHLNLGNGNKVCLSILENPDWVSLKSLDLRNNHLMSIETLTPIRRFKITELWLDGNPLCKNYSTTEEYIRSVKEYCPYLLKLDGVDLESFNFLPTVENYFPNRRIEKLVKQFAYHFFIIHDQMDKSILLNLYHTQAVFSLTLKLKPESSIKNLEPFLVNNRNIYDSGKFKLYDFLHHGPHKIIDVLKRLPLCLHDRTTFQYDVIFCSYNTVAVTVTGQFKILNSKEQILSFNRTFILLALPDEEYKIINDQYHVDNNVTRAMSPDLEKKLARETYELTDKSPREKDEMLKKLANVTTLKVVWARKFLLNSKWNLKRAITNFMFAYKSNSLPDNVFQ